jgi:hypothetical protein
MPGNGGPGVGQTQQMSHLQNETRFKFQHLQLVW